MTSNVPFSFYNDMPERSCHFDLAPWGSCFFKAVPQGKLPWQSVLIYSRITVSFNLSHYPHLARFIKFAMCNGPRHSNSEMIRHLMGRAGLCWTSQIGYQRILQCLRDYTRQQTHGYHSFEQGPYRRFPRNLFLAAMISGQDIVSLKKSVGNEIYPLEILKESNILDF